MKDVGRLDRLRATSSIAWSDEEHGWVGDEHEIVTALTMLGYREYKHEVARTRRDRRPVGGVWQGLDPSTGSVASVVWHAREAVPGAVAVVEIDGTSLRDAITEHALEPA